ncbi:iron complex outermembrane receptor protein [Sphingomonas naasensis]|uniref:TonB-dependent receptor n=1 Tax=Sphingomonas naasensis TaxID=1344951 RepID=A0A4S1W8N0_9SPHN|nr:TonB-dependent receptor [Sphingomonas naasensis]NIJ20659.1 iron complex outermembrane receptor protein [Sphingomonas naasensis]TGX37617.1 TonB-dependent receptor [Sphingomonas naasensis]
MSVSHRALAAALVAIAFAAPAAAQDASTNVADPHPARDDVVVTATPNAAQATIEIQRTPGGVALVPDTAFRDSPVQNIKDILAYVPGVITQPRMGDDARVSIRGSGLSRAYGIRGVTVLLDGIPMNTSDGLMDFFEIDPSAYRYVEVYKGGNALRYGANSLGGAINLVTPTGRDASSLEARIDGGSFGYVKGQASTGGTSGAFDWFVTASAQTIDGYRDHSNGDAFRGNFNIGYRISPNVETRFYVTGASTDQRIPGEVTKAQALNSPRSANAVWVAQDHQRNVDSVRVSNKTSFSFGDTTLDVGAFYNWRRVDHPIYQYLDYSVDDYGAFARLVDDRDLGGIHNRLTLGVNLHNGTIDTRQYVNVAATKGALTVSMVDKPNNFSAYAEDSLTVVPSLTLVAGVKYLDASRDRRDRFLSDGDQSGNKDFQLWSPKFGVLWEAQPGVQVFANISRSGEVPSYDANVITATNLKPQRATTYEVGTRGKAGGIGWDVSLYRSDIRDELQCLTTAPWAACSIINAGKTVHQGIEAGLDADIPLSASGDAIAVTAAYTYSDFNFDGDAIYGDNELPGIPKHYLRAELLYKHRSGFYAGPNVEWAPGHYFADNANTLSVDPYALLGLRAGFDTGERWSVYVEGRNLTDKRYISTVAIAGVASAASEIFNPGTGRAVYGGIRFKW